MGQHEDQVQEGGTGLEQTIRPGQDSPGNIRLDFGLPFMFLSSSNITMKLKS